jgi:hypothetical protein
MIWLILILGVVVEVYLVACYIRRCVNEPAERRAEELEK